MLLKRKLGLKSWVMERVVDAESRRRGRGLHGAALRLQIRVNFDRISRSTGLHFPRF